MNDLSRIKEYLFVFLLIFVFIFSLVFFGFKERAYSNSEKNHYKTFNNMAYIIEDGWYVTACNIKYFSNSDYLLDYNDCPNLDKSIPILYIRVEHNTLFKKKYIYHKITKVSTEDNKAYFQLENNKKRESSMLIFYPFFIRH